jgi:hypothetical protein
MKERKNYKTLIFRRRESTISEAEKNNYRKARKGRKDVKK